MIFVYLIGGLLALVVVGYLVLRRMRWMRAERYLQGLAADLAKGAQPEMNFDTPEGAILCLEECYRRKSIEHAVRCKDFRIEAKLMLGSLGSQFLGGGEDGEEGADEGDEDAAKPLAEDEELIKTTAETLELAYRKFTQECWPNFDGVKSYFARREPYQDGIVKVFEVCKFPNGSVSGQFILVGKNDKGWRVLNPAG